MGQVYVHQPSKVVFQLHNARCLLDGRPVPDAAEKPDHFERFVAKRMPVIDLRRENQDIPLWDFKAVNIDDAQMPSTTWWRTTRSSWSANTSSAAKCCTARS